MTVETTEERAGETAGDPTEPVDYWAINAAFASLLATLAVVSRNRTERIDAALDRRDLPLIAAASFALAKVVARERIGLWVREPFVEAEDGDRRPRGRRLRHAVGELVTCTRCMGAWSALGIVTLRTAAPTTGRIATTVFAVSAANDFLQAAFRLLTETADEQTGD